MATLSNRSEASEHSELKSIPQWRLAKIEMAFDERTFSHLTPLGKSHGMVKIKFTDNTAIADGCTRETLEDTIVRLVNVKLEQGIGLVPTDSDTTTDSSNKPKGESEKQ